MSWSANRMVALLSYPAAAAFCAWVAYSFSGWHAAADLASPPWVLPFAFVVHLAIHSWCVWARWTEATIRLAMASNFLLLVSVLLRVDTGDYPGGWLLIQGILPIPQFLTLSLDNQTYIAVMLYDWALLLLPAVTWVLLLRRPRVRATGGRELLDTSE